MLRNMFILCCATVCAVISALGIHAAGDNFLNRSAKAATLTAPLEVPVAVTVNSASPNSRITAIPKASDGHFWAEASVNNKAVRFLVDTGATVVALTPADAQRLGVNLSDLSYDQRILTASGETAAARVRLSSIGIGKSRVENVDAMVIRDGLHASLLGMSFLGRLSRLEVTPSTLILHP